MRARLFTFLLVGGLMVPQAVAAKDVASAPINPQAARWTVLPLPAIPHLDTIPWLSASGNQDQRQKVDMLLGPKFESIQFGFDQRDRPMNIRDASMQRSQ